MSQVYVKAHRRGQSVIKAYLQNRVAMRFSGGKTLNMHLRRENKAIHLIGAKFNTGSQLLGGRRLAGALPTSSFKTTKLYRRLYHGKIRGWD